MTSNAEPYYRRIPRLREERGLSQPELFRAAEGVGFSTVQALEMKPAPPAEGRRPRWRYPSAEVIESIAAALDVDPREFPEYRAWLARDYFDERKHGLETVLRRITELPELIEALGLEDPGAAFERELQDAVEPSEQPGDSNGEGGRLRSVEGRHAGARGRSRP